MFGGRVVAAVVRAARLSATCAVVPDLAEVALVVGVRFGALLHAFCVFDDQLGEL